MKGIHTPHTLDTQVRWVLWNVQTRLVIPVDHQNPATSLHLARAHLLHHHGLTAGDDRCWAWHWAIEVEGTIDPHDARPLDWSDRDLLLWATT